MNQDFPLPVYSNDARIPYLENNSYIYGGTLPNRSSPTRREYPMGFQVKQQEESSISLHEEPLLSDDLVEPPHNFSLESARREREFLIQNDIERQLQEREQLWLNRPRGLTRPLNRPRNSPQKSFQANKPRSTKSPYARTTFCQDMRSQQKYSYKRAHRPNSLFLKKLLSLVDKHSAVCSCLRSEVSHLRAQYS